MSAATNGEEEGLTVEGDVFWGLSNNCRLALFGSNFRARYEQLCVLGAEQQPVIVQPLSYPPFLTTRSKSLSTRNEHKRHAEWMTAALVA